MPSPFITVGPPTDGDLLAIFELIGAQDRRWHATDPRLAQPRRQDEIAATVAEHCSDLENQPLVARDGAGRVCGYAQPALFELAPDSGLLAYFKERNGTFALLAVPPPHAENATATIAALLDALSAGWRRRESLADMVTWPSSDAWIESVLSDVGFIPAHVLNHRPMARLARSNHLAPPRLQVRRARPADEDALVELNLGNVAHDTAYSPFIEVVPTVERAFRGELARLWAGEGVEAGAPLILVAEYENAIVGMAQTYFESEPGFGVTGRLPPGRYGYLHEVFVRPEIRGMGIGRALTQAALEAYADLDVEGLTLYFSPHNPLSRTFWPHLGFVPAWTTYMRLSSKYT